MQTWTHKTHHNSDLEEAITFRLIIYSMPNHGNKTHVSELPSGSPEIPKVEIFATLGAHNFVCRPLIEMRSKEKYNLHQKLSNDKLHTTRMQRNWGGFGFLVAGSQIENLTFGLSFGHNLCFKCPNGSCEPILDIYVPKVFQ